MKKILSGLLALTFVLSMGIMSFAADETTTAATTAATTAVATTKSVVDKIKDYLEGDDFKKIEADLKDAVDRVAKDPEEMAKMADEAVEKISKATGMDIKEVQDAIADSGLFKKIPGLYGNAAPATTTAAPVVTTTIVDTGSATGGIAIFATISVAAAAAFVCIKKN